MMPSFFRRLSRLETEPGTKSIEAWAEEDRYAAHTAWNNAVIKSGNKMAPLSSIVNVIKALRSA